MKRSLIIKYSKSITNVFYLSQYSKLLGERKNWCPQKSCRSYLSLRLVLYLQNDYEGVNTFCLLIILKNVQDYVNCLFRARFELFWR